MFGHDLVRGITDDADEAISNRVRVDPCQRLVRSTTTTMPAAPTSSASTNRSTTARPIPPPPVTT
jgi:hypothetical protein